MNNEAIIDVSIVILNYNGKQYLKDCLSSLEKINYPSQKYEIIVVDNGSTDGSISYVEKNFPSIRTVKLNKNYGFSKGNNIGVEYAKYPYIAFLNNDTTVHVDWLYNLALSIKNQNKLIVNSKMVFSHNPNILNQGQGHLLRWGTGFCKGAGESHELYNKPNYIHYPTGGSMLLRKDDFIKIGGLDEDFFAYHEDADFGWRAWLYGYKSLYVPNSIVYHKTGSTVGGFSSLKTYLITRNTISCIIKNCETKYFLPMLSLNIFFLFSLILFFLFPFKPITITYTESLKRVLAILKGIFSASITFPHYFKKRQNIQKVRTTSDGLLIKMGIIMPFWESVYYVVKHSFNIIEHLIEAGK